MYKLTGGPPVLLTQVAVELADVPHLLRRLGLEAPATLEKWNMKTCRMGEDVCRPVLDGSTC